MTHYAVPPLKSLPLFFILGLMLGIPGILFNRYLIIALDLFAKTSGSMNTLLILLIGIALSIESTNNYTLILPLILTVATVTAELLGGKPIYSILLQRIFKKPAG